MLDSNCVFCMMIFDRHPHVFHRSRGGGLAAIWSEYAVAPGHFLVVPTYHAPLLEDMGYVDQRELMVYMLEVKRHVLALGPETLKVVYRRMSENQLNEMAGDYARRALQKLERHWCPPQAYNVCVNDGEAAGQSVGHCHLHGVPRWDGDFEKPRGGFRNMFPGDAYSQ